MAYRGTFLVNPEGKIKIAEIHDNGIGRNADELLRKVEAAQFEHEGCKVYRFMDMGHYIYFTNCEGDVTSIESDSVRTVNRISRKPIIIKEQTLD